MYVSEEENLLALGGAPNEQKTCEVSDRKLVIASGRPLLKISLTLELFPLMQRNVFLESEPA